MTGPASTQPERVLRLTRELGVLRARDLARHGIAREHLSRLTAAGRLTRVGRGLYMLSDADLTEHHSLAEVAKRVPAGVVCLLSALRIHDLTTQAPFEVWLALPSSARHPRLDWPPLRVMRFSGPALTEGVEEHIVEGVPVRVYIPAKTVADCFRYRNKIGLDVALEALRETWRERRATMDELWRYAEIDRVSTVMRPYLESLITLEG
jgi:predicted transcriptional regulator of viral defense system